MTTPILNKPAPKHKTADLKAKAGPKLLSKLRPGETAEITCRDAVDSWRNGVQTFKVTGYKYEYIYIYRYMYMCIYMYIYIYTHGFMGAI